METSRGINLNESELKSKMAELISPKGKRFTWSFRRTDFAHKVAEDDVRNFLRWPVSRESIYTGFLSDTPHQIAKLPKDILKKCYAGDVGNPSTIREGGFLLDPNLVRQAYLMVRFQEESGINFEDADSILEIGGGYGAFAFLARAFGFKGKYVMYDFPEMLLLQEYWLSNVGAVDDTEFLSEYPSGEFDIVVAMCSLSEIPIAERNRIVNDISAKSFLITYQPTWDDFNNHDWVLEGRLGEADFVSEIMYYMQRVAIKKYVAQ